MSALDFEAIRSLLASYAFALDIGDPSAFAACFTDDGSFEVVGLPDGHPLARRFTGRAQLEELHAAMRQATQGRLRHLAVNVAVSGDGRMATSHSYLLTVTAGATATPGASGVYRDALRNEGGVWRFVSRHLTLD